MRGLPATQGRMKLLQEKASIARVTVRGNLVILADCEVGHPRLAKPINLRRIEEPQEAPHG